MLARDAFCGSGFLGGVHPSSLACWLETGFTDNLSDSRIKERMRVAGFQHESGVGAASPPSFVEVFEQHGFVWGGKWLYFDTIHFEYRPEALIYNGLEVVGAHPD